MEIQIMFSHDEHISYLMLGQKSTCHHLSHDVLPEMRSSGELYLQQYTGYSEFMFS